MNIVKAALSFATAAAVITMTAFAEDNPGNDSGDKMSFPEISSSFAQIYEPRLVIVKYKFKPDKTGYKPNASGFLCQICGNRHKLNTGRLIQENNSFLIPGLAMNDRMVISQNLLIPEENIATINIITPEGKEIPASVSSFFPEENAIALVAENSIGENIPEIVFEDADGEEQLYAVFAGIEQDKRISGVIPFSTDVAVQVSRQPEYMVPAPTLAFIVKENGMPAGITIGKTLKIKDLRKWRNDPAKWRSISVDQFSDALDNVRNVMKDNTVPVKIKLKSPPKTNSITNMMEDRDKNEIQCFAIILDSGELMVPYMLDIPDSNRIEEFWVSHNGNSIKAEYVGTMKKYGAIIIRPVTPIPGKGADFYHGSADLADDQLFFAVTAKPLNSRVEFLIIPSAKQGSVRCNDQVYPIFSPGDEQDLIVTLDGKIFFCALNLRSQNDTDAYFNISADELIPQMKIFNPDYAPKQEELFAIGWLGVQYQPLDEKLAFAYGISHLTDNGKKGLVITEVLPESPAEKAELAPGDVIMRIVPDSNLVPVELNNSEFFNYKIGFPWEYYDQIPEIYYDEIPMPWPDYNDKLNKMLSSYGIGAGYTMLYLRNAKPEEVHMTVEAAPLSFYNTKRIFSDTLGLTMCNLTTEVRNYMKMNDNEPGVVVAGVKSGSKASVAGIKPYEIITKVDDQPVNSIEQMQEFCQGKTKIKFEIKRLNLSRIVSVKTDNPVDFK